MSDRMTVTVHPRHQHFLLAWCSANDLADEDGLIDPQDLMDKFLEASMRRALTDGSPTPRWDGSGASTAALLPTDEGPIYLDSSPDRSRS